jgi:hypothetical protein
LLLSLPAAATAAALLLARPGAPHVAPAVREALRTRGEARVLVALAPGASAGGEARARLAAAGLSEARPLTSAAVVAGRIEARALPRLLEEPAVRAVSLDGVVHPAGQAGPAQIGADVLAFRGLDGSGRSVAVVDSGVDALHPDLGGAPFPNAKVVGGWNVAGDDGDVSDCSGHGTAVAGVAAGRDGVAPGAGVVALKVFSGACTSASFSDVLAAVDWAVANRERFHIDVLNLSLADDSAHSGFCDREDPASALAFSAARAAGIAVVAAAGNAGKADALAWPACFSDVAAVGMVYSASIGRGSWGGEAACEDPATAADVVPCASNAGSALAMLAPGVRWATDTPGGGRTTSFSGTSAAAPAAAGALLLARQARALQDPLAAVELLRATGAPVLDDKSGRTTPRVDVAASLDASDPVTGPCVATDSGVLCEAQTGSLAAKVAGVVVAVSLERLDAESVRVSLVAPDGWTVLLSEAAGAPLDVERAVYGRTADAKEPLSTLAGRDAAGRWALSVEGNARIVSWAIEVEVSSPRAAEPRAPALVLPVAVRSAGRFGAFFTSDVRLVNSDTANAHDATLRFGSPERAVTVRIPPSGTRALDDVLGNAFRTSGAAPLRIDAPASVAAFARTRSSAPRGGAWVLPMPVPAPDQAIGLRDDPAVLLPLVRGDAWRLNVGLVEVAGGPADVELVARDGRGGTAGVLSLSLPPGGFQQVNDFFARIDRVPEPADHVEVRVAGGKGRLLVFATAVDDATNDGEMLTPAVRVRSFVFPVVAPGDGARLDVKLANADDAPIRVKVAYAPAAGPMLPPVVVPIGRGETRLLTDILLRLFGKEPSAGGALLVTGIDGATMTSAARVFRDPLEGSAGFGWAPSGPSRGLAAGRRLALPFLGGGAKTSFAVVETANVDTRLRLSVHALDGTLLRVRDLTLAASDELFWDDLFDALGLATSEEVTLVLENVFGGALVAEALRYDPVTGDPLAVSGVPLP